MSRSCYSTEHTLTGIRPEGVASNFLTARPGRIRVRSETFLQLPELHKSTCGRSDDSESVRAEYYGEKEIVKGSLVVLD